MHDSGEGGKEGRSVATIVYCIAQQLTTSCSSLRSSQFETTRIAVLDLDKYFQALDKALLRYHSLKIGDINKIIKELWSLIYKGADITNIKIVSGADTKASRSYNYRVVMSKGGTEMDMRGRCSAGQRVLAR